MLLAFTEHAAGVSWTVADEGMRRSSHALATPAGIWLIDAVDAPEVRERIDSLGEPVVGVAQLLDRHSRGCEALAAHYGVSHHRVPDALPGFDVVRVIDRPRWHERALWWEARRTLVIPEAIGSAPYFAAGRAAAVHPLLRLVPPRGPLGAFAPDVLLCGHGEPVTVDADLALREALDHSRRDLPRWLVTAPFAWRS